MEEQDVEKAVTWINKNFGLNSPKADFNLFKSFFQ
jgi:hypothetical protein